ncbi:MAG: hypothetical protein AB1750_10540 [Chloroflexota bacterium]
MRNGNLFWGGILVLLGVLMAFKATEFFWPIVLIAVGGWIIWGAYLRGAGKTEAVSVDLQGAREVSLKISHGAGRLQVGAGASMGKALEGECTEGARVHSHLAGDRLEVRVGTDVTFIPFIGTTRGLEWNLRLSREVPFALELETGANQSSIDLREARVTSLRLQTGASFTDLTLPASGQLTAQVQMGAAELKIHVPEGVAGRIRSQSGLAEINVNQSRFPNVNGIYESPDFGTSPNRFDMMIEAGVGKVSID